MIRATPAAFNLDYQEIWLSVSSAKDNKERIHCWWIPAAAPDAKVWLYLHGNGSTMGDELKRAFWLHHLGYSTIMIDYRGYGRSPGKFPTEARVYEDAETVWHYLTKVKQIPPEQIFVFGHSLGGAIGLELATKHPEIAGLAIEASFTSMRLMVDFAYPQFGFFPVDLLLKQRFDSLSKVRKLQMPLLFLHGTADRDVPADMSQTLYEAALEPKKLLLIPQAGHQDVGELGRKEYLQAIQWVVEQAQAKQKKLAVNNQE